MLIRAWGQPQPTQPNPPTQLTIRIRKNYSKEKFLWELDKECWDFPKRDARCQYEKVKFLEESVTKLNGNITRALSRIAPVRIKNPKCNEPWKIRQFNMLLMKTDSHG